MEKNKKRGRKPKGGKLVDLVQPESLSNENVQNIILHLKCTSKNVFSVVYNNTQFEPYDNTKQHSELNEYIDDTIPQKLKNIATRLHKNDMNTRSNCFWCTHSYDTPPIYIPKSKTNDQYQVYGSFCCPECAAGYLFQEQLDQSTKFERYHLLHDLYGDVYEYKTHINPAPPPHYLLNTFFGTLTIDEYRKTITNKSIRLIDKPVYCTYPELFISSENKPNSTYKLYRKI
jgi:hypothetical protein